MNQDNYKGAGHNKAETFVTRMASTDLSVTSSDRTEPPRNAKLKGTPLSASFSVAMDSIGVAMSENLPEFLLGECPFPQTTAAQHVEKGKVVVNPPICSSRPRRTRIYRLKRSSRGIATVTRPHGNFARHGKIISRDRCSV